MNRQEAEQIITEYLKPIFGFALKRCRNLQDAEDLSQEIVLRAYRALLAKDDIADPAKFLWTIAHHMLSNYYRDASRTIIGVSADEMADRLADPDADMEPEETDAPTDRLQREIAYLSAMQRKIVIAYYFENRKQAEIAERLGIPPGTVKWHLFEARKELKRGMDTMRKASELKFNPIKFDSYGINGSVGSKSPEEFFRSTLSQNICYCVKDTAKTIHEIADDLGVSPVYVETEVQFLEKYGFLTAEKDRYLINFILTEPTAELLILKDEMYRKAAALFADELYDELTSCGILDDPDILCGQTDEPLTLTESTRADHNFLLWTLIPYIAARSGEKLMDETITFEEAATIRPDGAHNIFHATVLPEHMELPENYVYMNNWCGPMWNGSSDGKRILWQIDSQWSDRGPWRGMQFSEDVRRVLRLHEREEEGPLSRDEYTWLSERGYIKTCGDPDGHFKSSWQIVQFGSRDVQDRLLAIGERIKRKYKDEFDALKASYAQAELASVPAHMRKIKAYELQYIYHSDGWFLLHCVHALLENGRLKEPTEGQRKALTTLMAFA